MAVVTDLVNMEGEICDSNATVLEALARTAVKTGLLSGSCWG